MPEADAQTGFWTGLRAALARARELREDDPGGAEAESALVSPELALVTPELHPQQLGHAAERTVSTGAMK